MSMNNLLAFTKDWFLIEKRNSTFYQEVNAGLSTFLTMSYILLVNPQIMSKVGIPATDIVVSTAVSSAIASIYVGFVGNLPFGLAPGIGLSAYLIYGLILGEGQSIQQTFTSCFISGLILLFCSITGLSQLIMTIIPRSVKVSTIVGMGLQIALVGMTSVNLVVANEQTIVGLGPLSNYKVWFSFVGLIFIGSLMYHQVRGAILIGIIALTVVTFYVEGHYPNQLFQVPTLHNTISDYINFAEYDWYKGLTGVMAFIFIGIIDVSGIIYGMSSLANLTDSDGSVPGSLHGFLGTSFGTLLSAITGGTPIIVYVESAAGIKEGGRTGLTAVVIGMLFLLSIVLAPLFAQIPATATSPVSILVGAMMMSQAVEIDWNNMSEAIPAFLTLTIIPLTFSITNGIVFGLIAAMLFYVSTGQAYADWINRFSTTGGHSYIRPSSYDFNDQDTNGFLDYKPLTRIPSLILKKKDADALRARGNSHDEATSLNNSTNGKASYQTI